MAEETQVIAAVVIFLLTYGLIISEKVHRAVVALAGAVLLVLLGILTQHEAVASVDFNTLGLLIGMMIIVGITKHTGLFQFLAIASARLARGEPIRILLILAAVTAALSALLDNVTTVLLIVPVTISVTEALGVSPIPFLFAEIIASNIGGTATLIGDPPNIMIGSATGLGFLDFVKNLTPVVVVIFIVTAFIFWLLWGRNLKVNEEQKDQVLSFDPRAQIRDWLLLRKSLFVLGGVISGFLLHQYLQLESATIALSGAAILLILSRTDPEEALLTVEWPTIFFFLGLFIVVGALEKVGVIHAVARGSLHLTGGNLKATAFLILWLSAFASAFVDNIPFVATMIPLIKDIGVLTGIPVLPLWWALSLGACLGGNGTLIGASANVTVAGIAERNGYPFTFLEYTKVAFPLMVISILIAHLYLYFFYLR
ncbi:MAG: ArsB/NhaD family transporter [Bacillota bacterium]|nr:ArsB/NhaD family transporter [Bacillota bacterium]